MTRLFLMILFVYLSYGVAVWAVSTDDQQTESFLQRYDAAKAAGRDLEALQLLGQYLTETKGFADPVTIRVQTQIAQKYTDRGLHQKAIDLLNECIDTVTKARGKNHIDLFDPYFHLAQAHAALEQDMDPAKKYYDKALQILKRNNKGQSETFVKASLFVAVDMMYFGRLTGNYSTSATRSSGLFDDGDVRNYRNEYEYRSRWFKAAEYLEKALVILEKINPSDKYLKDKILIALTKIQLLETAEYQNVQPGVTGRLNKQNAEKKYKKQDTQLRMAITRLSEDPSANSNFISFANQVMMQLSVQRENMDGLRDFCRAGSVDNTARYASARLYDVNSDGTIDAPSVSDRVHKSIFRDKIPPRARAERQSRATSKIYFLPVCVHGQLKAVLIGTPTIEIENIN